MHMPLASQHVFYVADSSEVFFLGGGGGIWKVWILIGLTLSHVFEEYSMSSLRK